MTSANTTTRIQRMPVGFGYMPGPRQSLAGQRYDWSKSFRFVASYRFRTDPAHLARLLPPGFSLAGEPIVALEWQMLRNLPWLAGRGYNTIGVKFPAKAKGTTEECDGVFLSVLWENLADPIISGREELGYAKLYCEISDIDHEAAHLACTGSWDGFRFVELSLSDTREVPASHWRGVSGHFGSGVLHHKYIPATGAWGEADVSYPVLSPVAAVSTPDWVKSASGQLQFHPGTFEQLPTLCHIVEKLAALPQESFVSAAIARFTGNAELFNQRRIG